jgi:hypothetical protein
VVENYPPNKFNTSHHKLPLGHRLPLATTCSYWNFRKSKSLSFIHTQWKWSNTKQALFFSLLLASVWWASLLHSLSSIISLSFVSHEFPLMINLYGIFHLCFAQLIVFVYVGGVSKRKDTTYSKLTLVDHVVSLLSAKLFPIDRFGFQLGYITYIKKYTLEV